MLIRNKNHPQLTYDSVLIAPNKVSDQKSRFNDSYCCPFTGFWYPSGSRLNYTPRLLPICTAPMDTIASQGFLENSKGLYAVFSHRFQSIEDQLKDLHHGAQPVIGLNTDYIDILTLTRMAKHLLIDVANGGNLAVIELLKSLQDLRGKVKLWAGNVACAETYKAIAPYCDYVRVGIGGGSACLTRVNTGIGVGNITAIDDCYRARKKMELFSFFRKHSLAQIVADGGIRNNGDICKALAAGADLVMIGSMFAGTDESCAEFSADGKHKLFKGMASQAAVDLMTPGKANVSIEGASGKIKRTGKLKDLLHSIEGNLRSSMTYVNAHNLAEFRRNANLYRVDSSVSIENHSHLL